jgi:hypothetical protein
MNYPNGSQRDALGPAERQRLAATRIALRIENAFDVGVDMLLWLHPSYDATQMGAQPA